MFWKLLPAAAIALAICATGSLYAQTPLSPEHSAWASFPRGAWRKDRLVTETYHADGRLESRSVTTTTTTLRRANRRTVVLLQSRTVELAGRLLQGQERNIEEDLLGRLVSNEVEIQEVGKTVIDIDGKPIECEVLSYSSSDRIVNRTDKVYFSPQDSPYVLKRVSKLVDRASNETVSSTTQVVTDLDQSQRVLGITVSMSEQKAVTTDNRGYTTKTTLLHSMEIPGGVVREETVEIDANENVVLRSTLELIAVGEQRGLFLRR